MGSKTGCVGLSAMTSSPAPFSRTKFHKLLDQGKFSKQI